VRSSSRSISVVMRNPDSTKKTWTPIQPCMISGPLLWKNTTISAAMARRPSSAGKRFNAR
jgi:hypothetical protein